MLKVEVALSVSGCFKMESKGLPWDPCSFSLFLIGKFFFFVKGSGLAGVGLILKDFAGDFYGATIQMMF